MADSRQKEEIEKLTSDLTKKVKSLFCSEQFRQYLSCMAKFHHYSLNNTILIYSQRPDIEGPVAGFTTWKDKFHRIVKKGEHGIRIFAPSPYKKTIRKGVYDKATNLPVFDAQGKPVMEEKEVTIPLFRVVSVFAYEQTEGEPLPSLGVSELTGEVSGYGTLLEALKRSIDVPVSFEEITGGAKGFFNPEENRIVIKKDMSEVQTVKTLIHEMTHCMLHSTERIEQMKSEGKSISRSEKEVQAEAVAYTICQHYGIDTSDYSFGYLVSWSSDKEVPELMESLKVIRDTSDDMITAIDSCLKERQMEMENSVQKPEGHREDTIRDAGAIHELAEKLTSFYEDYDPYDFADTLGTDDRETAVTSVGNDLFSGKTDYIAPLRQIITELAGETDERMQALKGRAEELIGMLEALPGTGKNREVKEDHSPEERKAPVQGKKQKENPDKPSVLKKLDEKKQRMEERKYARGRKEKEVVL
jgi:antirestriction protein ArdC